MNFGAWVPVQNAPAAAPDVPGMLQARADALRAYPRGKSAMVLYARCRSDETLHGWVRGHGAATLERAVGLGARLVRFGASTTPDREFHHLMTRFVDRFGARPAANLTDDDDHDDHDHDHDDTKEQGSPNG